MAEFAKAEFQVANGPGDRKVQREMELARAEANYHVAKIKADDNIMSVTPRRPRKWRKAEYDQIKETDADVPGAIPKVKLDELSLKCKEADLAIEKAKRDQRVAGEEAKVAKAELEAAKRKAAEERPRWRPRRDWPIGDRLKPGLRVQNPLRPKTSPLWSKGL